MTTEGQENQNGQGEGDNNLIRSLRTQIDDLQKELKRRPADLDIETEVASRMQRRDAARAALTNLGFPAQMSELVTANVDGDITEDAVKSYLGGLGFTPGQQNEDEQRTRTQEVTRVSSLGAQVASASRKDGGEGDLQERLNKAASPAEIDALMREAGLSAY